MNSIAAAYKGALDAQERNRRFTREDAASDFLNKQRDYQSQNMQAGLSSLPDRTAADSAQAKLATAQANAGAEALPGQTANAAKQTTLTGAGLDMSLSNIPAARQANDAKNRNAYTAQHINDFAQFGRLDEMGDKAGALAHAQSVSDSEAQKAGTPPKKIVDYRLTGAKTPTSDNRAYVFNYDDGTEVPIPRSAIASSMSSQKTGDYTMSHTPDGAVQVLNRLTGAVSTPVPANPDLTRERTRATGAPSLAQQTMNQQVEISRRKLAGMDPAEIRRKTQKFTNTGRDNPDYDASLATHARLASKRKYGEDPWYDQQGEDAPAAKPQSATDRFAADPAMKGFKLGKQTGNGFEVFNSAGKLVGNYQ